MIFIPSPIISLTCLVILPFTTTPPEYINFFKPILFMARDSSSGFRQGHHTFTATRNTTEGVVEKEQTNNIDLGQHQVQEG